MAGPETAPGVPSSDVPDEDDQLGWDVEKHGRMVDAASDDEPRTVVWEG